MKMNVTAWAVSLAPVEPSGPLRVKTAAHSELRSLYLEAQQLSQKKTQGDSRAPALE